MIFHDGNDDNREDQIKSAFTVDVRPNKVKPKPVEKDNLSQSSKITKH